ncbi:hypothetical protein SLS56_005175 [Neofusicoccum ribis]|uniref:Uncharacterized protein n=1 Tax=Neofusicoccum ribis TaxID=45134 RepID=A0ABR3SVB3_9PEZI
MDIPSLVNDIEVKLAVPDSYEEPSTLEWCLNSRVTDLSDVESIASWVEDVGSLDPKESSSEYDEGTGTGAPRHPDDLPEAWYSEIDSQTPELDRPLEGKP